MAPWRPAKSLVVLRQQANTLWPDRSKASDGLIGNAAHAATASDHNPNQDGVVCAFDLTHDPAHGCDGNVISELMRTSPHPDVKYVIWSGRIFSRTNQPFVWRPYHGADPHTNHVHVSVGVGPDGRSVQPYDDEDPWTITTSAPVPPSPTPSPTPTPIPLEEEMGIILHRDEGFYHLIGNKLITIKTEKFFWELAGQGVKAVALDAEQMNHYLTAFGQPV